MKDLTLFDLAVNFPSTCLLGSLRYFPAIEMPLFFLCYFNKQLPCWLSVLSFGWQLETILINKVNILLRYAAFHLLDYPHENLVQQNFPSKNLLILHSFFMTLCHIEDFFGNIFSGTFEEKLGSWILLQVFAV